jgi:hypothetical protein
MRRLLIFLMMLAPVSALAQPALTPAVSLPGNLPADFYPKPSCVTPGKLPPKPTFSDQGAVAGYNARIGLFNKQVAAYNVCMQGYSAKVNADIQGIVATANGAAAEATGKTPPSPPTEAGNMPLGFYPKPPCTKPDHDALGVIPSPSDRAAMTAYNLRAKTFNEQVSTFNTCLKDYEDKAQRDIAAIQAVSHAAITAGP